MSTCPILALPDFTQAFVLECDALGEGIGVVLMKNRHMIAFESWNIRETEIPYSIYYKDMLTILHALDKFT